MKNLFKSFKKYSKKITKKLNEVGALVLDLTIKPIKEEEDIIVDDILLDMALIDRDPVALKLIMDRIAPKPTKEDGHYLRTAIRCPPMCGKPIKEEEILKEDGH